MHVPFCVQKCAYCDFYSLPENPSGYGSLLIQELEQKKNWFSKLNFTTLYFGGGTPSLLSLQELEQFFKTLSALYPLSRLKEITLEANPESLTAEKARFWTELGINRISLGIQSFNPAILKKLGRMAGVQENLKAAETAAKFFKNFSLDLIYGIPGQNLAAELAALKSLNPPHVSAYALTIAPGTAFEKQKKKLILPDESLNRYFYEIHETLESWGLIHYEISNYGRPGFYSAHNRHYWKRNFYLGLGAGASGFLPGIRTLNASLKEYQIRLEQNLDPAAEIEMLSDRDEIIETLLLGLRMNEGVFCPFLRREPELFKLAKDFEKQGWLKIQGQTLSCTLQGWTMLDWMLKKFYDQI